MRHAHEKADCAACTGENVKERATKIRQQFGWSVNIVSGDLASGTPPFAYTAGLTQLKRPELFASFDDINDARAVGKVLNSVGQRLREGGQEPLGGAMVAHPWRTDTMIRFTVSTCGDPSIPPLMKLARASAPFGFQVLLIKIDSGL